jgi:uncharacterized membrane protein
MSSIAQSSTSSQLVFDPRHSRLRRFSFIVLAVALIATGYLSYAELTKSSLVCLGGSNSCDIVTNSAWSRFYGVPVSYLGFAAWIIMGATLLLETRVKVVRNYGITVIFGVALFCFLYHCYLTFVSLTIIRAACQWCLTAHACMAIMLILASRRLYLSMFAPQPTSP